MLDKTLESPLDCKEIRPILKEFNPEYSLEGLMFKLKLQYFGHVMVRAFSSCGKWGPLSVAVCKLLTVVASLVAERGL